MERYVPCLPRFIGMAVHILGVRHHGPGSARNVKAFLEKVKPDIVLVEGPPEADSLMQWVGHEELQPPVALLCYRPDEPQKSVYYPFAEFSPEWQAILYARRHNIHVRFMDLPAGIQALIEKEHKPVPNVSANQDPVSEVTVWPEDKFMIRSPLHQLSDAAGFTNHDLWWEHTFEYRDDKHEVFDAVSEAMEAARESTHKSDSYLEKLREAYMRRTIQQAQKELFSTIAVVCGAWHAPALQTKVKGDNELLKGLPKVKIECTWIPWTFSRLSYYSGYGAGIQSPGWYNHVWKNPHDDGTFWLIAVANCMRKEQMDVSSAHIIEAVRLAEALASLRGLSKAGLEELNEAALSVLCNGESILLDLVHTELIVGQILGHVPSAVPKPPLQSDIETQQKKLRLPPSTDFKDYTLDLRKDTDLERSIFLHRLQLLGIAWGTRQYTSGKGTFKEQWRLQWDPAYSVDIIEKGNLGNTLAEAAGNNALNLLKSAADVKAIAALLEQCITAELPDAVQAFIQHINDIAAVSADVLDLAEALPDLITVARYGNVRKADAALVLNIIEGMVTRICIGLPVACMSVNNEAAERILELLLKLNAGIALLELPEITNRWHATLHVMVTNTGTAQVIGGYCTRLLHDNKLLSGYELMQHFGFAMSPATAPRMAAAWLEGFLKGSGTLLLLDHELWQVINSWLSALPDEQFMDVLPLLRRTFANFTAPERRKLGEKARSGGSGGRHQGGAEADFDAERGKTGLPVIMQLLGLNIKNRG